MAEIARFVEQWVDCSPWLGFEEDGRPMGGTSDCILVDIDNRTMTVIDLKYGRGVQVDADSEQPRIYALGAWHSLLEPAGIEIDSVRLVIHQPRLHHLDEHVIAFDELIAFGEELRYAADLTRDADAPLVASPKACRWCRVKGSCKEAATLAAQDLPVQSDFEALPHAEVASPALLSTEQINRILDKRGFIEQFLDAVQAEAIARYQEGDAALQFKLVSGKRGARKFTDPDQVIHYLSKSLRLPREQYMDMKLRSPTQLDKLLDLSDRQKAKLAEWTTQSEGSPSLVPLTDKRPALPVGTQSDFHSLKD